MKTQVPDSTIALIRDLLTIGGVVRQFTDITVNGDGSASGRCPLPGCGAHALEVALLRDAYQCHTCGKAGDVIGFVQEVRQCSWREAIAWLYGKAGVPMPEVSEVAR